MRLSPLVECLVSSELVPRSTREQDLSVVVANTRDGPELRILHRSRTLRPASVPRAILRIADSMRHTDPVTSHQLEASTLGSAGRKMASGNITSGVVTSGDIASKHITSENTASRNILARNIVADLTREHYALQALHTTLSPHLRVSVPRSVFLGPLPLFREWTPVVSVVSGAPGIPLPRFRSSRPKEHRRVLGVLLAWLADFQRETHFRRGRRTLPPLPHRLRQGMLHLDRNTGLTRYEDKLLEELLERTLPCDSWICAAHRELHPTGVTWDQHQLRVPRWRAFREQEFGFVDAGQVVYQWLKGLPRQGRGATRERHHLHEQTRRFLAQVGYAELSPEDLLSLYLLEALRRRSAHEPNGNGMTQLPELYELRSDLAAALAGRSLFEGDSG